MRIAGIIERSLVNGDGLRFVVFFQGCKHGCKGCQNPETWDMNGGYEITAGEIIERIMDANLDLIDGVTFSGGDPLYQPNAVKELAKKIKSKYGLNVWLYTGFRYEDIPKDLLENIDVVVDGQFIEELKTDTLPYRGSENQRIIEVEIGRND